MLILISVRSFFWDTLYILVYMSSQQKMHNFSTFRVSVSLFSKNTRKSKRDFWAVDHPQIYFFSSNSASELDKTWKSTVLNKK